MDQRWLNSRQAAAYCGYSDAGHFGEWPPNIACPGTAPRGTAGTGTTWTPGCRIPRCSGAGMLFRPPWAVAGAGAPASGRRCEGGGAYEPRRAYPTVSKAGRTWVRRPGIENTRPAQAGE